MKRKARTNLPNRVKEGAAVYSSSLVAFEFVRGHISCLSRNFYAACLQPVPVNTKLSSRSSFYSYLVASSHIGKYKVVSFAELLYCNLNNYASPAYKSCACTLRHGSASRRWHCPFRHFPQSQASISPVLLLRQGHCQHFSSTLR